MSAGSFPFADNVDSYEVCIPLRQDFRFLHEPAPSSAASRVLAGRVSDLEELATRLLFSNGGAFLVTGYRGVGKTSFVNQVVRKLSEAQRWAIERSGEFKILDIPINLPRRPEPAELMHHLVRRLYERLVSEKIFGLLEPQLQKDVELAYLRTSVNMTRSQTTSFDLTAGKEAGIDTPLRKLGIKLPFEIKRSWSRMEQSSFLGYDNKAAEYDLIRLSQAISNGYIPRRPWWSRWSAGLLGKSGPQKRVGIRVVYIFDELDKIDGEAAPVYDAAGLETHPARSGIDEILRGLKALFTTSGLSFIFVAGKDLYDFWVEDVGRGDSVYESVFAYDKYLPCLWMQVHDICDPETDLGPFRRSAPCGECRGAWSQNKAFCPNCGNYLRSVELAAQSYRDFIKYLSFRGRGIPRRVIRAMNEQVRWSQNRPVLGFNRQDLSRFAFYAELWDTLLADDARFVAQSSGVPSASGDRNRLAVYYLADWILSRGNDVFTETEAVQWTSGLSTKIVPVGTADIVISPLIDVLLKADFIEQIQTPEEPVVQIRQGAPVSSPSGAPRRFRVAPRRMNQLGGEPARHVDDLASERPGETLERCGDYTLHRLLGAGGMGKVYLGRHAFTRRIAAVKIVDADVGQELRQRFEREAAVMRLVHHPNIVEFFDAGEDAGRLYIAMEFLDGATLRTVLRNLGTLNASAATAVALPMAEALAHLHKMNCVRNDVKPGNIMLTRAGRVCLIDLGITKPLEKAYANLTSTGVSIGTPSYMAPEQLKGLTADARSDIFSFGVVLYETLTGTHPFHGDTIESRMYALVDHDPEPPSAHADVPSWLDAVVLRCLRKNPGDRFASMDQLRDEMLQRSTGVSTGLAELVRGVLDRVRDHQQQANEVTARTFVSTSPANPAQPSYPPPPPQQPASPGEFTQMFSAPPAAPPRPQPPSPQPAASPGEFTRLFSAPSAPPPPPPSSPPAPGSFTAFFQAPPPAQPQTPPEEASPVTLLFRSPAQPAPPRRAPAGEFTLMLLPPLGAKLQVMAGPSDTTIIVRQPRSRIGRGEENDIVLRSPSISRYHADIIRDAEGFWIGDLGSSGGVSVNGIPVLGQTLLQSGDLIHIGEWEFQFVLAPATPRPA